MSCYASYYNQRYGYHGHVFEGRFKSCIVKDDSYYKYKINENMIQKEIGEDEAWLPW